MNSNREPDDIPQLPSELDGLSNSVLNQLRAIATSRDSRKRVADGANERIQAIAKTKDFLTGRSYRVAFVGSIGVGKSSLIAGLSQLFVGDMPTDSKTLGRNSVLAVGAGGTTVCEVRVRKRSATDANALGLISDPYLIDEMRETIRDFSIDEWNKRKQRGQAFDGEGEGDPTSREVQRVIRNMTSTIDRYHVTIEKGKKKQHRDDPLDDIIARHDSAASFANDMIERAKLLSRTDKEWWWDFGEAGLRGLKDRFDAINHGKAPTAMLPRTLTVVLPEPVPGSSTGFDLELIDTRGFDGGLEGRRDIQERLRDHKCIIVACTSFPDAPSESLKALLRSMRADATLRQATDRVQLLLLEKGEADQVNGAGGDVEQGQAIKATECRNALTANGLEAFAADDRVAVFNTLRDPRDLLITVLDDRLKAIRDGALERLKREVADAIRFLEQLDDERADALRAEVDERLSMTERGNPPKGKPMRDPLDGVYAAIRGARFASQVQAMNRRNGAYWAIDAYVAARSGAASAATRWLAGVQAALEATINALLVDPDFDDVADHIRLRQDQLQTRCLEFINDFAANVEGEVTDLLQDDDDVWQACAAEWGQGAGFKLRVIQHLTDWSNEQDGLTAHEPPRRMALLPPVTVAELEEETVE